MLTFSLASSNSAMVITFLFKRAANNAASFNKLLKSAPVKPGVFLAIVFKSTSSANGLLRA